MQDKITIFSFIFILVSFFNIAYSQNDTKPDINVIYGRKHIFTINTPVNWINDKKIAKKIGLVCFFYPNNDQDKTKKNYFFANGIDKIKENENLADYIKIDIEKLRKKYPDITFEKINADFSGGITNGVLYSFSNLTDKYKEEVVYMETDDAFLIFTFASMTTKDYENYQTVFDKFIESFKYRGNNPTPFLDYMKNKKK